MSTISIGNLSPTGSDLLIDSENYLCELIEEELVLVQGGYTGVQTSGWCFAVQLGTWTPNAYQIGYNASYYLGKRFK
ncbi:hypothetical protein FD723_05575 [Nostoc sp. C052]|uniref:hypothetical protein n=1 Tax=Nostoc sp. C052 TaxID=2576902 RepID=UPI0015C3508E|nr:hypothetical protein [Nostoc sp. C052]QLE39983.1 hypothetical protein FD723_05575 [Nostoc sp. C052]